MNFGLSQIFSRLNDEVLKISLILIRDFLPRKTFEIKNYLPTETVRRFVIKLYVKIPIWKMFISF